MSIAPESRPEAENPASTPLAERPVSLIPIDLIDEHPQNARTHSWELDELAASIKDVGVLMPCHVIRQDSGRFLLMAGHRRKRAAALAGLATLPCFMVKISEPQAWVVMLAENMQRRDLNPIEEARAFQKLRETGMTINSIAYRLRVSESRISKRLGLLALSTELQEQVLSKKLTLEEAWQLSRQILQPAKGPKPTEGTGRNTKYDRWFNRQHALAAQAETACDHPIGQRWGPACSECWEKTIRMDELLHLWEEVDGEAPPVAEISRILAIGRK